jgi:isopentenyl-diphosphate delta-isomerase
LEFAAHRRLKEEMGFDCDLKQIGSTLYKANDVGNSLIEHEFDHVFIGHVDKIAITPNPEEVSGYKWIALGDLKNDMAKNPGKYTAWLKIILASDILQKNIP